MEDTEQMTLPGKATILETGTPQAIALRKENVIESVLKKIEKEYSGLKIAGVDDVEGIKLVSDAKKFCKKTRCATERICKAGREDAIAEQRKWIAVENYVVNRISPIEKELGAEELRIEKLRETKKQEEERKKKAEEAKLEAIVKQFALLGKLITKYDIQDLKEDEIQKQLTVLREEKQKKEAAAKKLEQEKLEAEEKIEAMKKQIEELQAQLLAKQAPPPAEESPAMPPTPPAPLPQIPPASRPSMHSTAATLPMPQANGGGAWRTMPRGGSLPMPPAKISGAAAMPMTKMPMPAQNGGAARSITSNTQAAPSPQSSGQQAQPLFSDAGKLLPSGSGKSEAERIAADKAALQQFAVQVDLLKKYVPDLQSARAAGMHDLFLEQIEKFVLYISKKQGEI